MAENYKQLEQVEEITSSLSLTLTWAALSLDQRSLFWQKAVVNAGTQNP